MATTAVTRDLVAAVLALFWILSHAAEAFVITSSSNGPKALVKASNSVAAARPAFGSCPSSTTLRMGLLDSVLSRFQNNDDDEDDGEYLEYENEGDFVRLQDMSKQFMGPGPVLLMYQVPDAIDDDEVRDILSDGAPEAFKKGIKMARLWSTDAQSSSTDDLMDMSLEEALKTVISRPDAIPKPMAPTFGWTTSGNQVRPSLPKVVGCPVVIFSGFPQSEIMESYNILGEEIYKETASYGNGQSLACATAVPNAMQKTLAQVLSEISGDHEDALSQRPQP